MVAESNVPPNVKSYAGLIYPGISSVKKIESSTFVIFRVSASELFTAMLTDTTSEELSSTLYIS